MNEKMTSDRKEKKSNAGNIYLMFLGLLLVGMGAFFMFIMWLSFQKASSTRAWLEIPCKIVRSEQALSIQPNRNVEYQWQGEYLYTVEGRVEKVLEKFPAGAETVCFVNPEDHSFSILKHDSRGAGYSIWFPGLFAVGGLGMMVGAVRKWNR